MTILTVTVNDKAAEALAQLLKGMPDVTDIQQERVASSEVHVTSNYERIKTILDNAKGKELFKDIEDPSAWQREIRKEWDRDF